MSAGPREESVEPGRLLPDPHPAEGTGGAKIKSGGTDLRRAGAAAFLRRRRIAAVALVHRAFGVAARGRAREKTLRAALTVVLSQKASECHLRRCADLGEQAALELGPEDLKLQAAGELFELWTGAADRKTTCTAAVAPSTTERNVQSTEEKSEPEGSREPAAEGAAAEESDVAGHTMLTETDIRAALTLMELPPTQELVNEFIGTQGQTFGVEEGRVQRPAPVSLDKQKFIDRVLDLVNPEADTLIELKSRRWAPWSLCGFSCDCLPWGSTIVTVSDQGDLAVARSSRALLCRGGYRSVDVFDIQSSKWMQVHKNLVHSSAVVMYLLEALLLFALCATFFHGHYATMTAVSSLAGVCWLGFRIAFVVFRRTSSATIYSAGLPKSLAGGSAGSFEVPRPDCSRLLDAFINVKLGEETSRTQQPVRYVCPRPAVFFAERWIKLNAPHTLELGPKQQHYMIEKVSDASLPGCRSFSQTTWHAGMISDIPWIHTHLSERELGTLCRWLLKGLFAALFLSFLIASLIPECVEESPCKDELLVADIAKLPPFSNVSHSDCEHPFDFSYYESKLNDDEEQHVTASGISADEMDCNQKASQGYCSPTHPEYSDMLTRCRPVCGECSEQDNVHCDERCRDYSCEEFTCGAQGMRRRGDAAISQTGLALESVEILFDKTCSFAGGGSNDGVCDEAVGWCLPGTDYDDCEGTENYLDNLHSQYMYSDTLEHRHLRWYAAVAEAGDRGCRHVTVLERCAACRSSDFACSSYNATSDFPGVQASCLEIEASDTLYETPWCQAAAAEQMFPACSCLPPHLRALPNWRPFVAILVFVLALIWVPTIWRWATYKCCFTEFGALGVDTTKGGHALKFHTMEGVGKKIAMQVMEQKLGRPLNHEHIKTYKYIVPTLRKPFNVGKEEKLHVHADYLIVETVRGCWACNFWTRSPARDFYYVLLQDTSFVESGQIGEPSTSKLAQVLLSLGFMFMFSSYVGGVLSYIIKRWHISPAAITAGKWAGLVLGVGSFFIVRAAAGTFRQQFLHVGCVAGGTARGRRNPHGGLSPFYVQIRGQSDEDIGEIKEVIRATRRESRATAVETDSQTEIEDSNNSDDHKLQRAKSEKGLRSSMRDIEQQVKDGLLDEHASVMTAKDITLRAIEDTYHRLDVDNSGSLSADEIANAIASLGIEMEARMIMKKWDTDRSGSLERAEFFSMMLEILDPKTHIAKFSAPEYCPMQFYGIDFDWLPWGQKMTALSRVQCDLQGRTGLGGLPVFADEKSVEIEVPRMRWLMLNQNPASSKKFNSYLAEALTLYTVISQLRVLADGESRTIGPRTIGSIVALVWLTGRLAYLFIRARANVHIHATGVPGGSMTKQPKSSFPVDLGYSNPLIGEFLQTKGVMSDAPTTEIVELVEPHIWLCKCKRCPWRETHRMLLVGDSHFAFEKVAGDHRRLRLQQEDDIGAEAEAKRQLPEAQQHHQATGDQEPEPFDVANKRLLLAPERTFRRRVLAGLVQDVYWVAISKRSFSLRKFAKKVFSWLVFAFFFALPISLISSKTNCRSAFDLYEIMGGREFDTSEQIPADQLDNIKRWCREFPLDNNPVIPSVCADLDDGSGRINSTELILNRRLDPAQYVRDKQVWCKQFGDERGKDPCECNWWRHHLPDWPVLAGIWGAIFIFALLHIVAGLCRKQRFYAEMGIAGVPNQEVGHMAKLRIPEDKIDTIPHSVLESRLGRPLRKKKLLDITYKPAFDCCKKGQLDQLHIHEDYVHIETLKGRCCLKRMCCCCGDASKMESDDYYVLLRDTGFVEIVEQNSIAKAVARWCLILTLLCAVVDILLKWFFTIPNPGLFDWSASTLAFEALDVTIGRASRIGIVLLPIIALLSYWIGAKLRHGYIHIGVRAGGTHRGFINRFGSTSPFYFRVKASSEVEAHGDCAHKPSAIGKFSEPYLSVVHALRSAKARSQQMDALVNLKGQVGVGTSKFGKGTMGHLAQGHLNVAAAALGAAPVVIEFAEGDLQGQALERLGDAAIELEAVATSFTDDQID